jgi:hypothetical protein
MYGSTKGTSSYLQKSKIENIFSAMAQLFSVWLFCSCELPLPCQLTLY